FERIEYTEMPDVYQMMVGEKSSGEGWSQLLFKYFAFVPGTHTLNELPFESIEKQINDRLVVVQRETNGPYGIYDVKKLQLVVPMKYINPNVIGNVFIARPGQKTYGSDSLYGAWSLSGQELLAPRYSSVNAEGAFIYATSADKQQTDVYDLGMKKLNPASATVFGQFIQGQPLLIQDRGSRKYSFINEQGKALPFSLPFDDVNPFSNGMAVVQKGSRYGAIDVHGKLRVPVTYSTLNPFQKNLASAQMDGFEGLVLIDKNNRVVKKLGSYTSYSFPSNSNEATYSIWDTQVPNRINVFDADGNQTDSFERE
ncbi:WG repeat-containing protein, partial [Pseudomonas gessardii]